MDKVKLSTFVVEILDYVNDGENYKQLDREVMCSAINVPDSVIRGVTNGIFNHFIEKFKSEKINVKPGDFRAEISRRLATIRYKSIIINVTEWIDGELDE